MQEIKHFGSVTVVVAGSGQSALVCSHQPHLLHEHENDWNDAIRYLAALGFEPPADDPDTVSPLGVETYSVRQVARLSMVAGA